MANKKNDNEYRWLQDELAKELSEDKSNTAGSETEHTKDDLEDLCDVPVDEEEQEYLKEMNSLTKALANEVNEHMSPKHKKEKTLVLEEEPEEKKKVEKERKLPVWVGILVSIGLLGIAVILLLNGRKIGKKALETVGLTKDQLEQPQEQEVVTMEPTVTPIVTQEVTPTPTEIPEEKEDQVMNVLLLGLDNLESVENADTIMMASMNLTDQTYHLVQFMRDLYVDIPGYGQDKLLRAYQFGGGRLVADTIEQNFDIEIAGYMGVQFEDFKKIIDDLGGVTITLTKKEAQYLNTTNYISKKSNRNVVKGKQKLNGDQALGYCRIQEVPNADNWDHDFGRVTRAKAVLAQIYKKISGLGFGRLGMKFVNYLPYIRTSMSKSDFHEMISMMEEIGWKKYDSLRVPIYKTYKKQQINHSTVYVPDVDATKESIHTLIYGEDEKKNQ